jgi:uncharacterized protein
MLAAPGVKEMAIKISDIPPEGLTLKLGQELDLFDKGTAPTAVTALLDIKPAGGGILRITGQLKASPLLQCSRCLNSFSYPVDTELSLELAPLKSMGTSPEHELVKGELDMEFYQSDEIEPVEIVREQVLIALPMVVLHHPDCKGLCSICGADRNVADCNCKKDISETSGAFSALKDLLKK